MCSSTATGRCSIPCASARSAGGKRRERGDKMMRAIFKAAMALLAISAIGATGLSAPAHARSSGEITVLSNIMAAKYEACRQEAKRQHLHLAARYRFLRACHKAR